jgi:mono/diheme cytochrome c family protein
VAVIRDNLKLGEGFKIMKRVLLLVWVGLFLLTACEMSSDSSNSNNDDAPIAAVPADYAGKTNPFGTDMASEGSEIFQANCSMCHGPQGHGDGPAGQSLEPKPKNLAVLQKAVGDDYLYWRVAEGKPGTSMVAWKAILTEEQIWKAVSFIRTLEE